MTLLEPFYFLSSLFLVAGLSLLSRFRYKNNTNYILQLLKEHLLYCKTHSINKVVLLYRYWYNKQLVLCLYILESQSWSIIYIPPPLIHAFLWQSKIKYNVRLKQWSVARYNFELNNLVSFKNYIFDWNELTWGSPWYRGRWAAWRARRTSTGTWDCRVVEGSPEVRPDALRSLSCQSHRCSSHRWKASLHT